MWDQVVSFGKSRRGSQQTESKVVIAAGWGLQSCYQTGADRPESRLSVHYKAFGLPVGEDEGKRRTGESSETGETEDQDGERQWGPNLMAERLGNG